MKKKETFDKFFDDSSIKPPPLFSSNFRESGPEWIPLINVDYETIGRVLICHLVIEHYINNLLSLNTRPDIDWAKARLTFFQKIVLIKKMKIFIDNDFDFVKGIEIINNIRNSFSHKINASIEKSKIKELSSITKKLDVGGRLNKLPIELENVAIIEFFTKIFCTYIAGYCDAVVRYGNNDKGGGAQETNSCET